MNLETEKVQQQRKEEPMGGVLYVVGTPIGNLNDLSPRARLLLQKVSTIACEDTRHSGKLLRRLRTNATLFSFHTHNTVSRVPKLISLLKEGKSLALISDAGLPGISDPGEKLVSAAINTGHSVICIPGPCAAITALVSSGLPCDRFCFEGFLPSRGQERNLRLAKLSEEIRTSIIYEAPHRLLKLLHELVELCGDKRPLKVSRELTKLHEEQIGSTTGEVLKHFTRKKPLGEFTLVLGGAPQEDLIPITNSDLINAMYKLISKGHSASDAAREIAAKTGHSRRILYELIHKNKP